MDYLLVEKIKEWRRKIAHNEGVELFRIISNATIDEIAEKKPKNKAELLEVKGIKERKFAKYGEDLLNLINDIEEKEEEDDIYSVSSYLDFINKKIRFEEVKVKGEISSFDLRDSYLFFSLKDKTDESVLECFMWRKDYDLFGLDLEEGLEVVIEGFSNVRKQTGRFNFQVSGLELVGEGVLKKAYDELKKKLEKEGLFDLERKKPLPDLVERIGLITSEKGAVINDFLTNLGKYGFKIKFFNSKVEGALAVKDLIRGIEYFKSEEIDVLVLIRGGGSLESLQAFNNETLVRSIASFKKPVICGIGHDKDIPLACLVADKTASTPTATTGLLNKSWEELFLNLNSLVKDILYKYQTVISKNKSLISNYLMEIVRSFDSLSKIFSNSLNKLKGYLRVIEKDIERSEVQLKENFDLVVGSFSKKIGDLKVYLNNVEKQLEIYNPLNQLKLGFSLVVSKGKIIKSIKKIKKGDEIDIQLSDGKIKSVVNDILDEEKYGGK